MLFNDFTLLSQCFLFVRLMLFNIVSMCSISWSMLFRAVSVLCNGLSMLCYEVSLFLKAFQCVLNVQRVFNVCSLRFDGCSVHVNRFACCIMLFKVFLHACRCYFSAVQCCFYAFLCFVDACQCFLDAFL